MTPQSLRNAFKSGIRLNRQAEREGDRVVVASGRTSRNRDWETGKPYRVVPAGARLESWRSNPLVLWHHNFQIPIGKANMYLDNGMLLADKMEFHRRVIPLATQNWIGDAIGTFDTSVIADLWLDKWLNATSIHIMFAPEDEPNVVETETEIVFMTSEVLEFSIVTIPGDRDSVRSKMESLGVPGAVATAMVGDKPLHIWKQETIDLRRYKSKENGIMARKTTKPVAEEIEDEVEEELDPVEITEAAEEDFEVEFEAEEEQPIELDIDLVAQATVQAISQDASLVDTLAQSIVARVKELMGGGQRQSASRPIQLLFKGHPISNGKPQAQPTPTRPAIKQSLSGGPQPEPTPDGKYVMKPTRFVKKRS